ncbi:hypothetical protein CEUSTIGMA_g2521.t1 [Chlamydomonas eustigma]|uniref:Uncharacterized protein n=1 Tax=Chlamydomonas eustigma TaxID=1157962 RepID=A0A250WW70_9CHLO|nr:hypothetical protein CEUSTIGMA_g2521.t1 [Chlamydomonas eustigma]|eukprot:GAX75077.1 hypothetical protein CEUSTIGMA_g2521.t1 [Chlamydomonas eustigma]
MGNILFSSRAIDMTMLPLDKGGLSESFSQCNVLASETVYFNTQGGAWAKSCDETVSIRTFGGHEVSTMTIARRQHGELRQRILSGTGGTILSVKTDMLSFNGHAAIYNGDSTRDVAANVKCTSDYDGTSMELGVFLPGNFKTPFLTVRGVQEMKRNGGGRWSFYAVHKLSPPESQDVKKVMEFIQVEGKEQDFKIHVAPKCDIGIALALSIILGHFVMMLGLDEAYPRTL